MATAPNLPVNVAPGYTPHDGLHNDVNASVNQLREDVDALQLPPYDSGVLTMATAAYGPDADLELPEGFGLNYTTIQRVGAVVVVGSNGGLSGGGDTYNAPAGSWPAGFRPTTLLQIDFPQYGILRVMPDGSWLAYPGDGEFDDTPIPTRTFITADAPPA